MSMDVIISLVFQTGHINRMRLSVIVTLTIVCI